MTNLSKAFAIALSMTVGIASVGLAQTTGKSRVVLTLDKGEFFLGENVLVHYCFENTSDQPIPVSVGSDYRGASRSLRFKVTVTDDAGTAMPDPDPWDIPLAASAARRRSKRARDGANLFL